MPTWTIQSKTPHRPPSGLTFLPSCTHERPTTAGVAVEAVAGTTAAVAVVGAGAGQEAAGGMANQGMPWLKPGTNRRRSVHSESRSLELCLNLSCQTGRSQTPGPHIPRDYVEPPRPQGFWWWYHNRLTEKRTSVPNVIMGVCDYHDWSTCNGSSHGLQT